MGECMNEWVDGGVNNDFFNRAYRKIPVLKSLYLRI